MTLRLRIPSTKNQWILLLLGTAVTVGSAIPLARGVYSLTWPKADGVITYSREKGRRVIEPDIGYRYESGGKTYSGNRYQFQFFLSAADMLSRDVEEIVGKYRAGDPVSVAINPGDPGDSVLAPGPDFEGVLPLGLGLVLVVFGAADVQLQERAARKHRGRTAKVLALAGAAIVLFGATDVYQGIRSLSWPTADGRIVYSIARSASPYETLLWYEYYVNGQRYLAPKYRTGGNVTPFRAVAEEAAKRYPVGRNVKVYYSPHDPREALLEPGVWWGNFVLPLVGALVLGAAWVAKKYAQVMATRQGD